MGHDRSSVLARRRGRHPRGRTVSRAGIPASRTIPMGELGEDYARVNSGGGWNDIWDDYSLSRYWSEFQTDVTGMDVASLPTPNAKWQVVFDSASGTYMNYARTTNRYNWYLAKLIAEKAELEGVQGQLPVIDSAAKNDAVKATGGGWIGLHCDPQLGGTPGDPGVVNYPGTGSFQWSGPSGNHRIRRGDLRELASVGRRSGRSNRRHATNRAEQLRRSRMARRDVCGRLLERPGLRPIPECDYRIPRTGPIRPPIRQVFPGP